MTQQPSQNLTASPVAAHVIGKCGGHTRVSEWLNLSVEQIYKFTYTRARGGTGGVVPAHHQQTLLDRAAIEGVDLRPQDFHMPPHGRAVAPALKTIAGEEAA